MKVLITGDRRWNPELLAPLIVKELEARVPAGERLTIIHGGAAGADAAAHIAAEILGANAYGFPAEWAFYGKRYAGHLRNAEMVNTMLPDLVLAFPLPTSKGTWDMVNLATKRGIALEVIVYP